jgi:hypothetical protein
MSENRFRYIVVGLLGFLVLLQLLILYRLPTPITLNSLISAPQAQKANLIKQIPLVRVQGGSVDVEVQNTRLDVEVQNTPLAVEINR